MVFTVSDDGKEFRVNSINLENGKMIILALYDGGRLVEIQSVLCEGDVLTFTTVKAYTNAKVMVWDNLTNAKSVCKEEIVK